MSAEERELWAACYRECYPKLLAFVRSALPTPEHSEDLAQEAFATAFASRHRFRQESTLATWLFGVALNLVRHHIRRESIQSRAQEYLSLEPILLHASADVRPDRLHLLRTQERALRRVLDELPCSLKNAFLLRELEGMPGKQAAERLGISDVNLRVRRARARATIRERLQQLGWE